MRKLFAAKLAMGGVLALLSLATLGGILYMGVLQTTEPLRTLDVPVQVVGPDGDGIYAGIVPVREATPYTALRAAAQDGNFTVRTVDDGDRLSVTGIAGYDDEGERGWTYAVTAEEGTWCHPDAPDDGYALRLGQQLLWRWSDEPVEHGEC